MGTTYDGIDDELAAWLNAQPVWFVATAPLAADGHVNVSPRGHDTFSVLGSRRVAWVDYTGSGIETVAHVRENGRVCLMFCSFGRRPRIVRLHGSAIVALPGEPAYERVAALHPSHPSTRAVVEVTVERVSDSCGFGVPIMDLVAERDLLRLGAEKRGREGLKAYREQKNAISIDGLPGLPLSEPGSRLGEVKPTGM